MGGGGSITQEAGVKAGVPRLKKGKMRGENELELTQVPKGR